MFKNGFTFARIPSDRDKSFYQVFDMTIKRKGFVNSNTQRFSIFHYHDR